MRSRICNQVSRACFYAFDICTDHLDHGYENTFIDAPETPAHQFVANAFKRAIYGTPAPDDTNNASRKLQKKQSPDLASSTVPTFAAPKEDAPPVSPSKLPGGILMTPGTANRGRKSVKFGAHVVDNEGKRGNAGRSGIPNDCPGKFPSPWTPGTGLKAGAESEQKPRTKLTAALLDARTTTQPRSGQKPKARDDSDITMDLGAPRSDSGKYWKEQFEDYTARSEKEVKKLIAKQQLAKNYAMKKDGEVTELITKFEQERKRHQRREHELEQQNKDFQERLRKAMAEQTSAGIEITALKNRIATLEKSLGARSPDPQEAQSSSPFQIFEDPGKEVEAAQAEQERLVDVSHLSQKVRVVSIGKENSPPKPRLVRRQTLPESPSIPQESLSTTPRIAADAVQVSKILRRTPRSLRRENESISKPSLSLETSEPTSATSFSARKDESSQRNLPRSPVQAAPSSPLPQPSPDPWMAGADESSIAPFDKMALPMGGGGGGSSSRPNRPIQSRRHVASKSVSQPPKTRETEDLFVSDFNTLVPTSSGSEKPERSGTVAEITRGPVKSVGSLKSNDYKVEDTRPSSNLLKNPTSDALAPESHPVEASSQAKKGRPDDKRKEEARKRLAERKKKKEMAK